MHLARRITIGAVAAVAAGGLSFGLVSATTVHRPAHIYETKIYGDTVKQPAHIYETKIYGDGVRAAAHIYGD